MKKKKYIYDYDCGIYQIRNLLDGKVYVGQSKTLRRRENDHFSYLRRNKHGNIHLQRAYNRDGKENFVFEIIVLCEPDQLTYYEQSIKDINEGNCYNMTICVDSQKGIKHSQQTKDKISKTKIGVSVKRTKPMSEEEHKNRSASQRGRKYPQWHHDKISDAQVGKKSPRGSTSKYLGISWAKNTSTWSASLQYHNQLYQICGFKYEIEAAYCYDQIALEVLGYRAKLNNISQEEIDALWEME